VFFENNEVTDSRKIDLEEKRFCVPSSTIQETFFSMYHVVVTPTNNATHKGEDQENPNETPQDEPQPNHEPQHSPLRNNEPTNELVRRSQ
jgi:hypothetical protein